MSVTNQISRYFFEIQEIGRDLSMMKVSYKLTKRRKKTKNFKIKLEMYIVNFRSTRNKLSASGNINHSIFKYKLMRAVSNLWLPEEQKNRKKPQIQEKN